MKICRTLLLFYYLLLFLPPGVVFSQGQNSIVTYYISKEGNNSWSGKYPAPNENKSDGPFASVEKAQEMIRTLKQTNQKKGMFIVNIREGEYQIAKTLRFTAEDSGSENAQIIYRNYNDENVRLIGGPKIDGFSSVTDPKILSRINLEYHKHIVTADLKKAGILNYGALKPRGFYHRINPVPLEIFYKNNPMRLARFPNKGWNIITEADSQDKGKFYFAAKRSDHWKDKANIWMHGYWFYDWADSYVKVKSINTKKDEIYTEEPHGVYGYKKGQRFYFLNILEELDEPGEWYLDSTEGVIYFWPPAPLTDGDIWISLIDSIISLTNASHITFEGLCIEICRGTAITVFGGKHNLIAGCTIRNTGNMGVWIAGGYANGVSGCDIYNTGEGGIILEGGDRKTLTPGNHFSNNNHIYNFNRWSRTYRPGIKLNGVGNRASNNRIHDAPHNAVMLSGNDHTIEFNEIYNVCQETDDVGAFYMGRDWTARGNVIRHNFFHDIGGYAPVVNSVYLDDAASGVTVYGNIFYNAGRGILLGGGRDNIIDNNIFVNCNPSIHVDARGLNSPAAKKLMSAGGGLREGLNKINYKSPPYSTRYPNLANILEDSPHTPKGNVIIRNISCKGRWMDTPGVDSKILSIKDNAIIPSGDITRRNETISSLNRDMPEIGFKKIPSEQIGLIVDSYRKTITKDNHAE